MAENTQEEKEKKPKKVKLCHECLEEPTKGNKLVKFDKGEYFVFVHEKCYDNCITSPDLSKMCK